MPTEQGQQTQEEIDAANAVASGQQQQIDWETDDNPYKKRYGESQGQVTPLVNTLKQFAEYDHNTKTWKSKTQQTQQPQQTEDDVEKLLEGYDPDFRKSLSVYTQKQIDKAFTRFNEQSSFLSNYNSIKEKSQNEAIKEFGQEFELAIDGKFNPNSPFYKLADEILKRDYAEYNSDGTFRKFSRPDAEYKAVVEAYGIIQRRMKSDPNFLSVKSKLGAIQGKGSMGGSSKKVLSFEEYNKLSDDLKDAYDASQVGT